MEYQGRITVIINGRTLDVAAALARHDVEKALREVQEREALATAATFTVQVDSAAAEAEIRLYAAVNGTSYDAPDPAAFGDFDETRARRPVIRDQGPPPVRRQPVPRPMRPPARQLSWLVEGRGR
ncbi:MAG: hypothetical protein Q8S73_38525 [Deltaproteobacteria bacterium]|nr:hypothetical protein [Myxococcales bacterium]MDP3220060.1 hypothetical protein [Deltaproteobacteria bacterium]